MKGGERRSVLWWVCGCGREERARWAMALRRMPFAGLFIDKRLQARWSSTWLSSCALNDERMVQRSKRIMDGSNAPHTLFLLNTSLPRIPVLLRKLTVATNTSGLKLLACMPS